MNEQTIRLLLSMIPPPENPDVLPTLLRAAWDNGKTRGVLDFVSDAVNELKETVEKEIKKRQ